MKSMAGAMALALISVVLLCGPVAAQQSMVRSHLSPEQRSALEEVEKINNQLGADPKDWLQKQGQRSKQQYQDQLYGYGAQNAEYQR